MQGQNQRYGPVMTVGDWVGTFLLSGIPIVGFILLIVWAFDSNTNTNKKNYARAVLLLGAIGVAIWFVAAIILGSFAAMLSGAYRY